MGEASSLGEDSHPFFGLTGKSRDDEIPNIDILYRHESENSGEWRRVRTCQVRKDVAHRRQELAVAGKRQGRQRPVYLVGY
jgi:hypothetical protein